MLYSIRNLRPATLFAFWLVLGVATVSPAQDLPQVEEPETKLGSEIAPELLTNGPHVRKAFREVVADTNRSMVRVKCAGKDAALGCLVRPDGWIVTKASLLKGKITCLLEDGRELEGQMVGVNKEHDLAMLKIEAKRLSSIHWSDSPLELGQWVATPGMQPDPVAVGIVSVLEREIPWQSGILGVGLENGEKGARVGRIMPNSAAEEAGLEVNDIITHCDGKMIHNRAALTSVLGRRAPGDEIELIILRNEEEFKIKVRLRDSTSTGGRPNRREMQNHLGSKLSDRRFGFPKAFQHDSVLQPSDCGGPLVNLDGEVIGINLARGGRTESYAISSSEMLPLLDELMSGKLAPADTKADKRPLD